ncbi:hypothetical protein A0H81_12282 [Grifola frondosa]|uniref:Uncharacterized protein n=1 Tax=Grifola frondosa TaxID=5627 RepID=A0A1C7LT54_GRIFR|nr:hypothetical protein A0H81_12282 [Grifola frondosa]
MQDIDTVAEESDDDGDDEEDEDVARGSRAWEMMSELTDLEVVPPKKVAKTGLREENEEPVEPEILEICKNKSTAKSTTAPAVKTTKAAAKKKSSSKPPEATSVAAVSGLIDNWNLPAGSVSETQPDQPGQESTVPNSTNSGRTTSSSFSVASAIVPISTSTPAKSTGKKNQTPARKNKTPVKVSEGGGFSSEDEEVERAAAVNSPIKNGKRVTSSSIVNFNDESTNENIDISMIKEETQEEVLPRSAPNSRSGKKTPVPVGARDNGVWSRVFLGTLKRYAGTRMQPWTLGSDAEVAEVISKIFDAVYGGTTVIKPKSMLIYVPHANQALCEWRSRTGNDAIDLVHELFLSSAKYRDDFAARAKYSKKMLEDMRFLYELAPFKEENKRMFRGLFRSQFVTGALFHHFNTTRHAVSVPDLFNKDDRPVGVIALAAVAVERAFHLFEKRQITVNRDGSLRVGKADDRKGKQKADNRKGGQKSQVEHQFSIDKHSAKTRQYAQSASTLTADAINKLIDKVQQPVVVSSSEDEDECRAILVDYTTDT